MAARPGRDRPLNVLAVATGGNVTQGILKALAKSTLPYRVIGTDISAPQAGLYTVDKAYVGPWAREAEFVPWLVDVCRREAIDVIVTGAELVLRKIVDQQEAIAADTGAVLVVPTRAQQAIADDKLRTCEWLERQGLPHPAFADASDRAGVERLIDTVGFPVLAKPRIAGGATGIVVCEDQMDIDYVTRKPNYVLQELLGTPNDEYTVGCFHDRHGHLAGSIAMRRKLLSGTTYRAELGDFPDIRAASEAITTKLGVRGPCNIQLRDTPCGPVCFEINLRFSGTCSIRAHYGFNEVEALLRHFVLGEDDVSSSLRPATRGIALRYWNEFFVSPEAHDRLVAEGMLEDPHAWPFLVETYGVRDA